MDALPEDVSLVLLRGVAAYIRSTPTQELPLQVRRFQNFRTAALTRHRATLLGLLDDDVSRTRITEWLDEDKPPLSKDEIAVLRIATERVDGWSDELTALSKEDGSAAGSEATRSSSSDGDALKREKEKLRKAKDELKRVRQEAEHDLRAERGRSTKLSADLDAITKELERARRSGEKEAGRATEATAKAERELRRARKDVEQAEKVAEDARSELRTLRKEVADLTKQLDATRKPKKKKSPARVQQSAEPKGPREPLPTPKGRFEDDPDTLAEWLDAGHVHLLVDGYNVTKAEGGFGELELEKQRDRLIQEVGKLTRKKGISSTVVFDGSKVPPGTARRNRGPAQVEFSSGETADDHIVALLDVLPRHPVVVATNDKELQGRVAAKGATVATSNQLLELLR